MYHAASRGSIAADFGRSAETAACNRLITNLSFVVWVERSFLAHSSTSPILPLGISGQPQLYR